MFSFVILALTAHALASAAVLQPLSCWVVDSEPKEVHCTDERRFKIDPALALEQVGEVANVYCSYRYPNESRQEMRERLIAEDLIQIALGNKPRCFTTKLIELPNYRQAEAAEFAAQKQEQTITKPAPPELPKFRRPKPITFHHLARAPRRQKLAEQHKNMNLPPEDWIRPGELTDEFVKRTLPQDSTPTTRRKLELCLAVDTSGSMSDDTLFLSENFGTIEKKWAAEYPGGIQINVIEFGQDDYETARLRRSLQRGSEKDLRKYLALFAPGGFVEPKFDAIAACARTFSLKHKEPDVERIVMTLTDEPGDLLVNSPTDKEALAIVAARQARYTELNPEEVDTFSIANSSQILPGSWITRGGFDWDGYPRWRLIIQKDRLGIQSGGSDTYPPTWVPLGDRKIATEFSQIAHDSYMLITGFRECATEIGCSEYVRLEVTQFLYKKLLVTARQHKNDPPHLWLHPLGHSLVFTKDGREFDEIELSDREPFSLPDFPKVSPYVDWSVFWTRTENGSDFIGPWVRNVNGELYILSKKQMRKIRNVFHANISNDGHYILIADTQLGIHVLDARGRELSVGAISGGRVNLPITWIGFDADSKTIVTRHVSGRVYFWQNRGRLPRLPILLETSFAPVSLRTFSADGLDFHLIDSSGNEKHYLLGDRLKP